MNKHSSVTKEIEHGLGARIGIIASERREPHGSNSMGHVATNWISFRTIVQLLQFAQVIRPIV